MKAVLGLVCGFVLTLAVFGSGLGFAAWLLAAKPPRQATATVSVAELWTKKALPVNKAGQGLERLPAAPPAPTDISAKPQQTPPDPTVTGAIAPKATDLPRPHLAWCASRYRSYHPDDNSYRSYSGQLRPCISPYLQAAGQPVPLVAGDGDENGAGLGVYVADGGGEALSADHVDYCFSRYRSYRPEDNSYQPYSGGPRRQCQ
ncbi:BA14K family protein [Mesorhizobium sp. M7A.F.Ca.US.010.02.1.1]|uniref:BA14K family protein n=1 Tax=Mesorhizobium sp. M7A.F.Ca.US.010.02.1.1 TaxID=2496743 RepID=UPI000FD1E08D|nr:BA14K family protein [Mesorhizobium sp. M7A.F.Ca.US.010.02.1.1]RUW88209.1 BA14K family protein [Mesorhizobium sp. M7A.F.Ca.US.010.02.1.1]